MSEAVHFTRIKVRRMPGFPRGGLAVDKLAPGVNVIYGPNASGKTTLVKAMQRVLRGQEKGYHADSLEAELVVAGVTFDIDHTPDVVQCRSGGVEKTVPLLAREAVEAAKDRFVLALHDLVQNEDEHDIVGDIVREAAGGYDLKKAVERLGFSRDQPSRRSIKPVADYDNAKRDREVAEERLVRINEDEQRLADLIRERKEVENAENRSHAFELALKALETQNKLAEAREAFAAFPDALSNLTGDEWNHLAKLKSDIEEHERGCEQATESTEEAERIASHAGLPDGGVPREMMTTLGNRCNELRNLAPQIEQLRSKLNESQAYACSALARLGPNLSTERAKALDAAALDSLFKFLKNIEEWRAFGDARRRLNDWLSNVPPSNWDSDTLSQGIELLQRWLAARHSATAASSTDRVRFLVVAGICGFLSLAMAFVHPSWLLLLLIATAFAVWSFWPRSIVSPAAAADIESIQSQWALKFHPLPGWTEDNVRRTLMWLQEEWPKAKLDKQVTSTFDYVRKDLKAYQEWSSRIEGERQQWRSRLGVDFNVDDVRLYLFAQDVHQVQVSLDIVDAEKRKLDGAQHEYDRLINSIKGDMDSYFSTPTADLAQVVARVDELRLRQHELDEAIHQQSRGKAAAKEHARKLADLGADRTKLFADLGLTTDNEGTLRQWIDRLDDYRRAQHALRIAEHDHQTAMSSLGRHQELLGQTREQLEAELDGCRQRFAKREDLDREIGKITGRVQQAKEESALEAALAREAACLDELRSARDNDANQLIGNVLFRHVARQQRDFQHPGVFTRASELFGRVTHGRYELRFETGDSPAFRAFDTVLGYEQELNHLSSGTRLQLLLAVRVAFVEQQERGLQLPLIFDETLGNSDERRAQAIIEAAIQIARGGRQVFYLTAQYDELGKWRRVLEGCTDVPHREFDLAALRELDEADRAPVVLEPALVRAPPVPAPNDDDWETYGRVLNVPAIDPRGYVGEVHLWHLIQDVDELHRLLCLDVKNWGQLERLVEMGDSDALRPESVLVRRAATAAEFLDRLFVLWRQGRGRPIDRAVLESFFKSFKLNRSVRDKLTRLAKDTNGDAKRVIRKLRARDGFGLQHDELDALDHFLEERGYLDDQPILDADGIRDDANRWVESYCREGLLSRERVEQLIAAIASILPASDESFDERGFPIASAGSRRTEDPPLSDRPGKQQTLF